MPDDLTDLLKSAGVRFVRVVWCDNANVIRAKAFHASIIGEVTGGVGISAGQQGLPVVHDAVAADSGLGPVGEVRLVPDWNTFTPLPYAPGHARVMGDMAAGGKPWPLCPRDFVRRMKTRAAQEGFEVNAAFENEFYLLRATPDGFEPIDETVFAMTLAMDRAHTIIDELTEALFAQSVPVQMYYPESGPGQHELSTRYTTPLSAAEGQVIFRETTHAVAAKHGLLASFLPKVFESQAGSGCHLHLSLWREGQNVFPDPEGLGGLSATGRAFLAGILHHLPALCALVAPSPNSYRRLQPQTWSGAFRCWGPDNREAAIRVPSSPSGKGATHFEIKTADASSNPYLACGAAIAAGLDGVKRNLDPGPPVTIDPGTLSEADRAEQGIEPLPTNLGEAIEWLRRDDVLLEALGPELARAYLAVRSAEWEALQNLDLETEVKMLLERY